MFVYVFIFPALLTLFWFWIFKFLPPFSLCFDSVNKFRISNHLWLINNNAGFLAKRVRVWRQFSTVLYSYAPAFQRTQARGGDGRARPNRSPATRRETVPSVRSFSVGFDALARSLVVVHRSFNARYQDCAKIGAPSHVNDQFVAGDECLVLHLFSCLVSFSRPFLWITYRSPSKVFHCPRRNS